MVVLFIGVLEKVRGNGTAIFLRPGESAAVLLPIIPKDQVWVVNSSNKACALSVCELAEKTTIAHSHEYSIFPFTYTVTGEARLVSQASGCRARSYKIQVAKLEIGDIELWVDLETHFTGDQVRRFEEMERAIGDLAPDMAPAAKKAKKAVEPEVQDSEPAPAASAAPAVIPSTAEPTPNAEPEDAQVDINPLLLWSQQFSSGSRIDEDYFPESSPHFSVTPVTLDPEIFPEMHPTPGFSFPDDPFDFMS